MVMSCQSYPTNPTNPIMKLKQRPYEGNHLLNILSVPRNLWLLGDCHHFEDSMEINLMSLKKGYDCAVWLCLSLCVCTSHTPMKIDEATFTEHSIFWALCYHIKTLQWFFEM